VKILISTTYYLPNISGITIYINKLAEQLVKRGHEVTILTSWHDLTTKKEETIKGVKIKRLKIAFKIGKGAICPSFLIQSIKESRKHDLINCHLPQFESLWIVIVGKILNKKIFLTHHTDLSFWKGFKNKLIDSGVFFCQYLAALLSTKIISYTNDYSKNSYFLKNFSKKIVNIYPPINIEKKIDFKLKKRIDNLTKNKKYVIGFCGRIAKQKGIEILIKSIKLMDDKLGKNNYVILMVGPIKVIGENYYDYLNKKYKLTLNKRFVFMGNIKRNVLYNFYNKIDLLVLPSNDRLESFGWVQVEAMKCGTPCVATDLPGMRIPILKTGFGKLFENNNEIDLAKKIELVLKKGKKYYQNKFNKNLETFDYKKSLDNYEKLFLERI